MVHRCWLPAAVSVSVAGSAWDPAGRQVCGEDSADWLGSGDEASPLAGAWETDEEQEGEVRRDHLQTSAAGSGSSDITTPFSPPDVASG